VSEPGPAIALAKTRLLRPPALHDGAEIVHADVAERAFPAHFSAGLGLCVKTGPAHDVVANGRPLVYPDDAVSVRAPGCVWASRPGRHGFVSLDIEPEMLHGISAASGMRFAPRAALPSISRAAGALAAADSTLHAEQLLTSLLARVVGAGLLVHEPDPDSSGAVVAGRDYLASHLAGRPSLTETAQAAGVDRFTLLRRFRQELNTTPHAYLVMLRLNRAQSRLAAGAAPADVAIECGFSDQAHLGRWFRRLHGITPTAYARQVRPQFRYRPARRH
jgi:AraC-like DNA-binding protein